MMQQKHEYIKDIFFEELHLRHIYLLMDPKNKKYNSWFYKMAIINTFDDIKTFLVNLEKIKTKCIIAIQKKKIIGYLFTSPLNQNKTCIKINTPNFIDDNFSLTKRSLTLELIRKSISNTDLKTSSWIINSEVNNLDLISCSRELGFQPLQEIKLLSKSEEFNKTFKDIPNFSELNNFIKIDNNNIQKVLNFIRSNESILTRNIFDFNQKDISLRNDKYCGSIFCNSEIVFTILKDINYFDEKVYSLTRGPIWDSQISSTLIKFLENIFFNNPRILLKINSEDKRLYKFLRDLGFMEVRSELILVRNNLIKRELKSSNRINNSLESILDKINPQGNPFPSPFPICRN